MDMDTLCTKLDSVLIELMECLDTLEILRRRFSEAVSEVVNYFISKTYKSCLMILTHIAGVFQLGKGALLNGSALCERSTL